MIIHGGQFVVPGYSFEYPFPATGVYDLSLLEWKQSFDPDAESYTTPDVIKAYYQLYGMEPAARWTDSVVQEWFQGPSTNETSDDIVLTNDPARSGPGQDESGSSTGVVAGGVVGGVLGLALVGCLVWFILRRKRRREVSRRQEDQDLSEHWEYCKEMPADEHALAEMEGKGLMVEAATSANELELPATLKMTVEPVELPGSEAREKGGKFDSTS